MTYSFLLDYWAELDWRTYVKHLGLYVTVAITLSLLGPFNTYGHPFLFRFSYWIIMLGLFGGIVLPMTVRLVRRLGAFHRLSPLLACLCVAALATLPMTAIVMLVDQLFYRYLDSLGSLHYLDADEIRAMAGPTEPFVWTDCLEKYINVFSIVVLNAGTVSLLAIEGRDQPAPPREPELRAGIAFLSRLPDHLGTDLIYLQMEGHYLRAVTTLGEALILMRFRDAMVEIGEHFGRQVHRSWWVAGSHVSKLSRSGRRIELVMSNNARIPVSASYRPAIENLVAEQSRMSIPAIPSHSQDVLSVNRG